MLKFDIVLEYLYDILERKEPIYFFGKPYSADDIIEFITEYKER